jgi:hypothetical protein
MSARPSRSLRLLLALVLLAAGAGFLFLGLRGLWPDGDLARREPTRTPAVATATPLPTATEPILPPPPTESPEPAPSSAGTQSPATHTAGPGGTAEPAASATPMPAATTEPATPAARTPKAAVANQPSSTGTETPIPRSVLYTLHQRLGVCGGGVPITQDLAARLGFGWYLDWSAGSNRYRSEEVAYMPMIRLQNGKIQPGGQALLAAVDAQPGALWLIGNEPDVKWQDNVTAEAYAQTYHDLYIQLKARDPTCQVAIGGISQPTPLRLRYLDQILEAYQARYGEPMPVEVWNVHNFILREERDSWGVEIPPGMPDQTGRLREIADHDDLAIFRRQIVDFRRWMKERGQQNKPLIVTEYGILMPADYGFPPEKVKQFMLATFDYFNSATDPALGYPADGYRLVQRWCWFSLVAERYPTGNLVDAASGKLTPLGRAFRSYAP